MAALPPQGGFYALHSSVLPRCHPSLWQQAQIRGPRPYFPGQVKVPLRLLGCGSLGTAPEAMGADE